MSDGGRAFHANLEGRHDIRVQAEFDIVVAELLDRVRQLNLAFFHCGFELMLQFIGNSSSGDGTEHAPVFARLGMNDENQFRQALG